MRLIIFYSTFAANNFPFIIQQTVIRCVKIFIMHIMVWQYSTETDFGLFTFYKREKIMLSFMNLMS